MSSLWRLINKKMNVKSSYASWLSKQCNWNYKTFTRPYFNMQDAYIDQGLELVSKNKGVNGLF